MLSDAFWSDVTARLLGSLTIPPPEIITILLKDLVDCENSHILDEWCDDALDDVLTTIVNRAGRLQVDREALSERFTQLRASLRLTLKEMLDRSPAAHRWRRLLLQHGDVPVGALPLSLFFTPRGNRHRDLSRWADTAKNAVIARGSRFVWLKLMFGGALPIPQAMATWALDRLGWDAKALYTAVGRKPLGEVWERERRIIAAHIDLPDDLVRLSLDAVTRWMGWKLGEVTPPYPWAGFYLDLTDLLAGQIDPQGKLPEDERLARFEKLRRLTRAESADMYRDLIDRRLGDLRFADFLLDHGGAPSLQVLCWYVTARSRLRRLLGTSVKPLHP